MKAITRISILSILCMFATIGISQTCEIGKVGSNLNFVINGSSANVLIDAGFNLTTGQSNTLVGSSAGQMLTTGSNNTLIGKQAGFECTGDRNTVIGAGAANGQNASILGSDNIIIGYQAGWFEAGDHKLYIENSDSATPLIYGEFDNDLIKINGTFHVRDFMKLTPLNAAPSCTTADKGTIYMDNGTNKLRVCNGTSWDDLN